MILADDIMILITAELHISEASSVQDSEGSMFTVVSEAETSVVVKVAVLGPDFYFDGSTTTSTVTISSESWTAVDEPANFSELLEQTTGVVQVQMIRGLCISIVFWPKCVNFSLPKRH